MQKFLLCTKVYVLLISLFLTPNALFAAERSFTWERVSLATSTPMLERMQAQRQTLDTKKNLLPGEGMQQAMQFAYDPHKKNYIYMATDSSAIWRSTDAGLTWQPSSKGFYGHGAISILPLKTNSGHLIAAANTDRKAMYGGVTPKATGLYLSKDYGTNWAQVYNTMFCTPISRRNLLINLTLKNKITVVIAAGENETVASKATQKTTLGEYWQPLTTPEAIVDIQPNYAVANEFYSLTTSGSLYLGSVSISANDTILINFTLLQPKFPDNKKPQIITLHTSQYLPDSLWLICGKNGVFYRSHKQATFEKFAQLPDRNWQSFEISQHNSPEKFFMFTSAEADPKGEIWRAELDLPSIRKNGDLSPTNLAWTKGRRDPAMASLGYGWGYFSKTITASPWESGSAIMSTNGKELIYLTRDGGLTWQYSSYGYSAARLSDMTFTEEHVFFGLTDNGIFKRNRKTGLTHFIDVPRIRGFRTVGTILNNDEYMLASIGGWQAKELRKIELNKIDIATPIHSTSDWMPVNNNVQNSTFTINNERFLETPYKNFALLGTNAVDIAQNTVYPLNLPNNPGGYTLFRLSQNIYLAFQQSTYRLYTYEVLLKNKRLQISKLNYFDTVPKGVKVNAALIFQNNIYVSSEAGVHSRPFTDKIMPWKKHTTLDGFAENYDGSYKTISLLAVDNILLAGRNTLGYGKGMGIFIWNPKGQKTWTQLPFTEDPEQTIWSLHYDPIEKYIYAGTSTGIYRCALADLQAYLTQ